MLTKVTFPIYLQNMKAVVEGKITGLPSQTPELLEDILSYVDENIGTDSNIAAAHEDIVDYAVFINFDALAKSVFKYQKEKLNKNAIIYHDYFETAIEQDSHTMMALLLEYGVLGDVEYALCNSKCPLPSPKIARVLLHDARAQVSVAPQGQHAPLTRVALANEIVLTKLYLEHHSLDINVEYTMDGQTFTSLNFYLEANPEWNDDVEQIVSYFIDHGASIDLKFYARVKKGLEGSDILQLLMALDHANHADIKNILMRNQDGKMLSLLEKQRFSDGEFHATLFYYALYFNIEFWIKKMAQKFNANDEVGFGTDENKTFLQIYQENHGPSTWWQSWITTESHAKYYRINEFLQSESLGSAAEVLLASPKASQKSVGVSPSTVNSEMNSAAFASSSSSARVGPDAGTELCAVETNKVFVPSFEQQRKQELGTTKHAASSSKHSSARKQDDSDSNVDLSSDDEQEKNAKIRNGAGSLVGQ